MHENVSYSIGQFVRDLTKYISPYRRQFFIGFFFRSTSDLSRLYPAFALSSTVTVLSRRDVTGALEELVPVFIIWGLLTIYHGFAHNLSKFFGYQVAEKAGLDLYKDCLSHLFKLDFAWQEKENSGNKMKRIDKGLEGVNITIRRIFDVLIEATVNTVGILTIFFTLDPVLSFGLVFFMITYFLLGTYLMKRAVRQEQVVNKSFENLNGLTFEALNNIQTIKALSIDRGISNVVKEQTQSLVKEIRKRIMFFQSQAGALLMYERLFEFSIIVTIAFGIVDGRYELSLLVLFLSLFQKVSSSADELTDVTQQLALAKIWVSRSMSILNTEPTIEHPEKVGQQQLYPENWKELKIDNVRFSYKRKTTLQNISLTIRRGEKVGIVGLSGAGKSTLFKLLLDLYEDYEGDILFDEISLKNMQRQSFIDHIAVVLQDTELFDMTLKENIEIAAVHGTSLSTNFLKEVLQMAHLEEVVENLPEGVHTIVGEKGIKLSGGQRQRVGIARALYRQPDILLLDEATSHLDARSEKEIQHALQETMHKFTTIVIAHRLSTIKAMDKIIVLEHGKVVEQGTFEELLEKKGAFSRMWHEQKI